MRSFMATNKEHRHPPTCLLSLMAKATFALFAVSVISVTFVSGQVVDRRSANDQMREWADKHFPYLVKPDFARLELARMLPELNDSPEKLKAPFKIGEAINFRLVITNNSSDKIYFPITSTYEHNLPRLLVGEEAVPYKQDIEKLVRGMNTQRGYRSVRYEQVEPDHTVTEVVKLNDWYEPLQPGLYRLIVRRRFILGGDWVDSPPINFEVVQ